MGRAMFDDITPPSQGGAPKPLGGTKPPQAPPAPASVSTPQNDATTEGEHHSIREVSAPQTQNRQERRARRAERRQLGSTTTNRKSSWIGRFGLWALAIVVLAVALSAIGFVFIGKTTISVVPLQESITLSANTTHTAYTEPEDGELGYQVITHTIEASESIPATGRETVEEKASGKIIVYNNHSANAQRLIKNTRFESPTGDIYRVRNSFSVPGMNGDTPGSIEITVFADVAGDEKNISALGTRFTIPGLKGDPRFNTFHAELSEPITGGFVGEKAIVDETTLTATRTNLQTQLRAKATQALLEQVPEDDIVFENSITTTFESLPTQYNSEETADVREIARIHAISFNEAELARKLADAALATTQDGVIRIDNPTALTFTIDDPESFDITSDPLVQFTLAGTTNLTWEVDTEALKQDLVGKDSSALNTIMSGYPGIKSAQATIRPFWKSSFPNDVNGISVEIITEK